MNDFDYKKYSLENLEKWMRDALTAAEATPEEIYDVIKGVVDEEYHYHKHQTSRCYDLLALLNGNGYTKEDIDAVLREREYYEGWDGGASDMFKAKAEHKLTCDKDDKSAECQKAWNDFWEDSGSSEKSSQYTEEELNAMCDKAASDEEKNKCREYNLREAEYYDKRVQLDAQQDKVVKWQLPVEVDGISGEYYVQFPDDLMEAANIKEDDLVEWIDRKDGSFELRKVSKPISIDEC
jgi:hypothetical protein